ncbi:MAG: hypothetical protein VX730_05095 [Pseudomonadota bacterium]|nr:hypothetical protein [Pseudomonadota bacterium]
MITMIMAILHTVLLLCSAWISLDYFAPEMEVPEVPETLQYLTYVGVVGISVVWALVNVIGGGLLGVTGGSIGEGLKMGLILGMAISLGRMWPYAMTVGLVALFFAQGLLPGITILIFAAVCLALQIITGYIWSKTNTV